MGAFDEIKTDSSYNMIPALLTTLFFSISAVAATQTAIRMGSNSANFWRLALATVVLAIYAHLFGSGVSGPGFWFFFLSGVVGFGIGDIALFQALPRIGSRLCVLLTQCLAAPFAALMEWFWMGETMQGFEILSAAVILAGVGLAVAPSPSDLPGSLKAGARWSRTFWIGIAFGVIAGFGQGGGAVLSRQAYSLGQAEGFEINGWGAGYQRILGGVLVSGIGFWLARRHSRFRGDNKAISSSTSSDLNDSDWKSRFPTWAFVVINSLAGPIIGIACYQWALATTKTGVVLSIVALTPLTVIPLSRWIEGERPTQRSLIGGIIAVVGVAILTTSQ